MSSHAVGVFQVFVLVFVLLLFDPTTYPMFHYQEEGACHIDHLIFISYLNLVVTSTMLHFCILLK